MSDIEKLKVLAETAIGKDAGSPAQFLACQGMSKMASPAAVLELIAEIERQSAQFKEWQARHHANYCAVADERDQLKAENEDGLSVIRTQKQQLDCYIKDAERYRILRDKKFRPGCLSSDPEKAKYLDEYMVCGDKMDDVIDAQLAKVKP